MMWNERLCCCLSLAAAGVLLLADCRQAKRATPPRAERV